MQNYSWQKVLRKVEETLNVYPKVKGIQVLNDMGNYMFPQYARRWIPDSANRRRIILQQLTTWRAFSNSSPVVMQCAAKSLLTPAAFNMNAANSCR